MTLRLTCRTTFPWLAGLFLALAGVAQAASTNSEWFHRAWQSDAGLPDNTVVGVAQSGDGFLWVATQSGLARFDGMLFREFAAVTAAGRPTSLLESLFVDRRDRLWVGKAGGLLVCVDHGRTTALTPADGLPVLPVRLMVEDPEGALWVSYLSGGVVQILDGRVRTFTVQDGLPDGGTCQLACGKVGPLWFSKATQFGVFREGKFVKLGEFRAQRIATARSGGVWLYSGGQLFKYTEPGGLVMVGSLPVNRGNVNATVLYEDRSGGVWIGTTESGLFRFDGTRCTSVRTSHHDILSVTEDREGNTWVGTRGGGLNRLQPRALDLVDVGSGVPSEAVRSVCQDTTGDLWAATQSGTVTRYHGDSWVNLSTNASWPIEYAQCVAADPQGGVWIGTQYLGVFRWRDGNINNLGKADGMAAQSVRALLSTPAGDLWIGTEAPNALQRWRAGKLQTIKLPASSGSITAMVLDVAGDFWAGTADGQLFRVREDGIVNETPKPLAQSEAIRCLCATPDGSLWIGYGGRGVGRLQGDTFRRFDSGQGLDDDYISHIVADGHRRLWFAGNRGVFYVAETEFDSALQAPTARIRSISFGGEEGLPNLQASHGFWPGAIRTGDGDLLIPTLTGLARLDVSQLKKHQMTPPVFLLAVKIDGLVVAALEPGEVTGALNSATPVDLGHEAARVRVPPDHQRVIFSFTALNFTAPKNVFFQYKLADLDNRWMDAGAQREVTYTHIRPGDYTFRVRACNEQGVWSPQDATVALTVLPHFWETWTFRIGAATGLSGLLAGSVAWAVRRRHRRRIEQLERQRAMERERARIAQDLHDDLGAGLTEISFGSEFAQDPTLGLAETREYTREIGTRARELVAALDEIVWAVNPKNDTVSSLASYACQYAERFLRPTRLRLRLKVARDLPVSPLNAEERHNLFLAFKEALHNVAQHSKATDVQLTIEVESGVLTLVVGDNGCGFDPGQARSEADGLGNMRRRLEQIGGRYELVTGIGTGTTATFKLPVRESADSARR